MIDSDIFQARKHKRVPKLLFGYRCVLLLGDLGVLLNRHNSMLKERFLTSRAKRELR